MKNHGWIDKHKIKSRGAKKKHERSLWKLIDSFDKLHYLLHWRITEKSHTSAVNLYSAPTAKNMDTPKRNAPKNPSAWFAAMPTVQ